MTSFIKKRIYIHDLEDPAVPIIEGKTFVNCDLVGPANITFLDGCNLSNSSFFDCDIVPVKDGVIVKNAIGFKDITVTRSRIIKVTILVPPNMMHYFIEMGVQPVGFTKDEASALQSSQTATA